MKITKETMELLKNFALLNSNMLILEGSSQRTMTPAKTVMVEADFPQKFPKEIGIYELTKFINAIKLFDEAELDFETKERAIIVKDENAKFSYYGTQKELLSYPKNSFAFPDADYTFTLPAGILSKMKSVGMPHIVFDSSDGVLKIIARDYTENSSNTFEHILIKEYEGDEFQIPIKAENLSLIEGEYTVDISNKGVTRFTLDLGENRKIKYHVANSREAKA